MTRDSIEPKLPALKMTYGNFSNSISYGAPCPCDLNMLSDEIEYNLTEFYGDQYGYISIQIQQTDYGFGGGYILPTLFSWGLLNVLGMPAMAYMKEIEMNVAILDSNRELLAKYSSKGKSRVVVAFYYGYRQKYAGMLVSSNVLNEAMSGIRSQIQKDAIELRQKLIETGPIKNE